jgi:hypothetical protein
MAQEKIDGTWEEIDAADSEIFHFPDDGKELTGTLLQVDEDVGTYGSKLYHIETEGGLSAVWGSQVLDRRLQRVNIGDEIKIVYKGIRTSEKSGREYKDFAVLVRK